MPYIEFEVGFLYNIQNEDYIFLYSNIFGILDEAKFEHEFLKEKIEYTRRHVDILESFMLKDLSYEDTVKIQEMSINRRQMMASMRDIIDNSKFLETQKERDSAKLLKNWIKIIRKDIKARNTIREWSAAHYMEYTVEGNEDYKEALKDLRVTHLYNAIVKHNKDIRKMETERGIDRFTKRETKEKRRSSLKDLNVLLWVLNAMLVKDDEEGKKAREAGNLIYMAIKRERTLYRFRKTLNKKKLEKKKLQENQEKPENKKQKGNKGNNRQQQGNRDAQAGN